MLLAQCHSGPCVVMEGTGVSGNISRAVLWCGSTTHIPDSHMPKGMSLDQDGGDKADIWLETSAESAHMGNVTAAQYGQCPLAACLLWNSWKGSRQGK